MTRAVWVLAAHSFRRSAAMLAGLGVLLAGFEFLLTQVASYLFRRSAFDQLSMLMPEFVRNMIGPSALAFMSFSGIVGFGYFHPIIIAAVLALTIAIASEPAAEVEQRFVDLTLARPLGRADVVTRTLLVFAVATALLLGAMVAGTMAGLACCTPPETPRPGARLIASLAISLGAVMTCWAGITLAVAASVRRRAAAGVSVGVLALAAFLLDYLGRAWEPARAISAVSPFHYFEPTMLIAGDALSLPHVAVLVAIGAAGSAIGYIVFSRRDI